LPDTSQTRRVAGRHVAKHASWRLASVTRMSEAKSGADFSHSRKPRPSLNASADTSLMRRLANRNPLFTLRRRQASLTIEPLHQSFAVSVSALFSGSERNSPQQIDQRRGVRCTTKTKSRAFLAACGCASGTTGTTELEARKSLHGPCGERAGRHESFINREPNTAHGSGWRKAPKPDSLERKPHRALSRPANVRTAR
jgi:hypothetical protein